MKENNSLMYGIVGVLIGGGIVWLTVTNAVNNNSSGMMQMMGIRNQTNSSALTMKNSNVDRHFIEQMIPHHEDAIGMARVALQKAEHPEIKKLAQDIEKSQSEEIVQMKSWYKEWFGIEVSSENEDRKSVV